MRYPKLPIFICLTFLSFGAFSAPIQPVAPPQGAPAPGGGQAPAGEQGASDSGDMGFFQFQDALIETSLLYTMCLPDRLPEFEHVVSTYHLRLTKTFSPGTSIEGSAFFGNEDGVTMRSFGLAFRPYFPMDLVAPYLNVGLQYLKFKTNGKVGGGQVDQTALSAVIGLGALIPFSSSFYGRLENAFYVNPGAILSMGFGVTMAF